MSETAVELPVDATTQDFTPSLYSAALKVVERAIPATENGLTSLVPRRDIESLAAAASKFDQSLELVLGELIMWKDRALEAEATLQEVRKGEPTVAEDECPACHRNWGEHRSGYSASRCPNRPNR